MCSVFGADRTTETLADTLHSGFQTDNAGVGRARGGSNGLCGSENLGSCSDDDDDEVTLNVLRCQLTYLGQVVTSAEAWFNHSLRPRKPEGSLGTDSPGRPPRPRVTLTDTARCLNYLVLMMK